MSYFSIADFIESGRKSLADKNYWSALSIALALPSMCSRVMFKDDKYKDIKNGDSSGYWYMDSNNKKRWHDRKCYIDFCKKAMRVNEIGDKFKYDGFLLSVLGSDFAEILYQLRCDIIHAGIANICSDNKGIYLTLGNTITTKFKDYIIVNLKDLCNVILEQVDRWSYNNGLKDIQFTYVFDINKNKNDKLLYERLCDKKCADNLEEKFIKENEERLKKAS